MDYRISNPRELAGKVGEKFYEKGPIRFTYRARSDLGRVRTNNEDALIEAADLGLFGVCDGLGGHLAGEVASSIAATTLREIVEVGSNSPEQTLKKGIREANLRILRDQEENPEHTGMGTTVTTLWLAPDGQPTALIGHVGDSRAYLRRAEEFQQLTDDHSPVYRLYKQGLLTKEQMQRHPQKNLLDRSLGILARIEIEVYSTTVSPGDLFLLCTDGLTDSLSDSDIQAILTRFPPEQIADQLISRANAQGGQDNITVVLLEVLDVRND